MHRRLLIAAFILGVTLQFPGWAAVAAQPAKITKGTPTKSRGQGNGPELVWLKISAFTDAPVVGADVRVSARGSKGQPLVEVPAATNRYGVVPVLVRSHPSAFRVTVSGGSTNGKRFQGHLRADVVLTDPARQIVVVNPVTTLVSHVLDNRPNLKLDDAEALVRRFLQLPVNYSLGLALRQNSLYASPYFSPVALMAEVLAAGGLDAFMQQLLAELRASPSATHSFATASLGSDPETTLAENLASGAIQWIGGSGAGWVMQSSGLAPAGATQADIDNLIDALNALQSAVENLSTEVAQLSLLVQSSATQTQYNTIVVPAQTLATQVNGVQNDLAYFAQGCPPLVDDGTQPPPPSQYCISEKSSINVELNDVTIQQAYGVLEGYIADNATTGFRGMLHLYSLWLAQSKAFFRPADSTKMQNLYDYWDSVLTQAANLKVELLHENGAQDNSGGQQELLDFLGDTTQNPPTNGTFQKNQAANMALMFPPVPVGTVVATVDHTMWALLPWQLLTDRGTCTIDGITVPCETYYSLPAAGCYTQSNPSSMSSPRSYLGYNWGISPTTPQWQAALKFLPSGTTNWEDWLIQQTSTTSDESPSSPGFFNLIKSCNILGAWSTTVHVSGSSNFWDAVLLNPGKYTSSNNSPYALWPVRTLGSNEQYFWYE